MNVTEYLQRIDYYQPLQPDVDTLHGLQLAHMQTIPFENLDIALNRPIRLDEESLWEKVILNKRGGFCYELNGLFAQLLKTIGYEVTYLNARVFDSSGSLGIDFDHLALLVVIPSDSSRWLADVGFGDSFNQPLKFDSGKEQDQGLRSYRLEIVDSGFIVWQRNYDGSWERQYFFNLEPHDFPREYESACLYHQTSPESTFTRGSIISRATADGRVSLEADRLLITKHGHRSEHPIPNQEEYSRLLKEHFGVTL
jgi:N-hydroxyarylamine O-acetyltransferase